MSEEDAFLSSDLKIAARLPAYHQDYVDIAVFTGNREMDLNTSITAVPNMSAHDALRELTQNLIDACTVCNGTRTEPSYEGLRISTGTRGARQVPITIVHNGNNRLAEIVNDPDKWLTFTNYGSYLPSRDHLLCYGVSAKRGVNNQIGQHGEGFCHAITVLLRNNPYLDITMTGLVRENHRYTAQRWRFYTKNNKVKCSRRYLTAKKYRVRRVCVELKLPEDDDFAKLPRYDIARFLAPTQYMRNAASTEDAGAIIMNPAQRGNVYVWHFWVTSYMNEFFRYAYDLFLPTIGRDRNDIGWDKLREAVARCWSQAIVANVEIANTFYDLLQAPDSNQFIEIEASTQLSTAARHVLANVFRARHPRAVPIAADETQHQSVALVHSQVVTRDVTNVIQSSEPEDGLCPSNKTILDKARDEFEPLPNDINDAALSRLKRVVSSVKSAFRDGASISLKAGLVALPVQAIHDNESGVLKINLHSRAWPEDLYDAPFADQQDYLLGQLLCEWIPRFCTDRYTPATLFRSVRRTLLNSNGKRAREHSIAVKEEIAEVTLRKMPRLDPE